MKTTPFILEVIPVGLFQCQCVILGDPASKEAIVIDPGDEGERIFQKIEEHQLTVRSIVHTHTHIDHIGATTALQQRTHAKVCLHREDLFLYEKMEMQAAYLGIPPARIETPVGVDEFLIDGYALQAGSIQGVTYHCPGHTPGSCGFFFPTLHEAGILFAGDTLFAGSIGRTDLWKGDMDQEIQSIRKKYFTLPDEVIVVPGHGPATTIGIEKETNPFLS